MQNLYALKDVKSGFMSILVLKNDDLAIRSYKNMLNDSQSNIVNTNPEDFELWCLGSYDTDSGLISPNVRFVCSSCSI